MVGLPLAIVTTYELYARGNSALNALELPTNLCHSNSKERAEAPGTSTRAGWRIRGIKIPNCSGYQLSYANLRILFRSFTIAI